MTSALYSENAPAAVVTRLLRVISRQLPMTDAENLLAENLIVKMDGKILTRRRAPWFAWVRFLHAAADKKMSALTLAADNMRETGGGIVTVNARWRARIGGQTIASPAGAVVYVVRGGKIAEIHTHRANYVFIHGQKIAASRAVFYWTALRAMTAARARAKAKTKAGVSPDSPPAPQ